MTLDQIKSNIMFKLSTCDEVNRPTNEDTTIAYLVMLVESQIKEAEQLREELKIMKNVLGE